MNDCCKSTLWRLVAEAESRPLAAPTLDPNVPKWARDEQFRKKTRQAQGWNRALGHVEDIAIAMIEGRDVPKMESTP